MSDSITTLSARLQALGGTQHPLRLSPSAAPAFEQALRSGDAVAQALPRNGRGRTVALILERAKPKDAVSVVGRLVPVLSDAESFSQRLSAAGWYPLLLSLSLVVAATAVFGISIPALAPLLALPESGAVPSAAIALAVFAAALFALAWLGLALVRRADAPVTHRAARALAEALAFRTAAELFAAGVTLEVALASAALWTRGRTRRELEVLATALGTGQPASAGPAARLLVSGAQRGVAGAVLDALATQRRIEAQCEVPDAVLRVQTVALLLGGIALVAIGVALFSHYTGAPAGFGGAP